MLVGCWLLERCTLRFSDGRPSKSPFQKGMICYMDSGYMQACLSRDPRDTGSIVGLERGHRLSAAEKALAFDSYLSYAGRYTYDDTQVTHLVEMSLNPSVIDHKLVRSYVLQENKLLLFYTHQLRQSLSLDYELVWKRSSPQLS